jgi:hypothetical protein
MTPILEETMSFFRCEKCGKKLIKRLNNGIWYFAYGRKKMTNGEYSVYAPVEIFVHGSVKMKCFDDSCSYWNTFNFLPPFPVINNPNVGKSENCEIRDDTTVTQLRAVGKE